MLTRGPVRPCLQYLTTDKPADFRQVDIDTIVQENAISVPGDAKLKDRARARPVSLERRRRAYPDASPSQGKN